MKISNESMCTARNQWRHLVSVTQDMSSDTPVRIEHDANLFVAEMDGEQSLDRERSHGVCLVCRRFGEIDY